MKFYIIMICSLFLVGCSGTHCLKVGGDYEGIEGNVEYCYDFGESEKAESPVFSDDEGGKFFGIDEDMIKDLLEIINAGNIMSLSADHPMKQLRDAIERERSEHARE